MKLIIDINHPAHIHYFRNLIYILRKNGHQIKVFCRDREHINYLSKYYNIAFISKGKRNDSSIGQIQYMLNVITYY